MRDEEFRKKIEDASNTYIPDLLDNLGYHVVKRGSVYSTKEMDSLSVYKGGKRWHRFSSNEGGNAIDFLTKIEGMSFNEALKYLNDFNGFENGSVSTPRKTKYKIITEEKKNKNFFLPKKCFDNFKLKKYLSGERKISIKTIEWFIGKDILYESYPYHHCVFVGRDKDGFARFASRRGTSLYKGEPFKRDVKGSDKNYGFNIATKSSDTLYVFEAPIDMISYIDIYKKYNENMIALGGLAPKPLVRWLEEHNDKNIKKIIFCLDNDEPGQKQALKLSEEYKAKGYETSIEKATKGKDFNEMLVYLKNR